MKATVTGFECLKELHEADEDFGEVCRHCDMGKLIPEIHIQEGYLLRENQLWIPMSSFRKQVIWELHGECLGGYLVKDKIITLVDD